MTNRAEFDCNETLSVDQQLEDLRNAERAQFKLELDAYMSGSDYLHAQLLIDDYEKRGSLGKEEAEAYRREVLEKNMARLDAILNAKFQTIDEIRSAQCN